MIPAKAALVAFALVAGLVCVQAAGGIKGRQQSDEGQFRFQPARGPALASRSPFQQQQQQQYAFQQQQAPAPAPQAFAPFQQVQQQQASKTASAGPGQVAPVFSAVRVQPSAPAPAPAPLAVQQVQVQEQEPEQPQQQQQQQAEEIEPNPAAQEGAAALLAPARAANGASASEEEANPRPEPYNFQYSFNAADERTSGSSTREEQQDASGRVTGFYTLKGEDGRDRRVDYVADASGFRATISTNELGTANKDSADSKYNSPYPAPEPPQPISAASVGIQQSGF